MLLVEQNADRGARHRRPRLRDRDRPHRALRRERDDRAGPARSPSLSRAVSMRRELTSSRGLHVTAGGAGNCLLILLHGLGANSAVWRRFTALVDEQWQGRWLAPDFRGHGRSIYEGPYDFGTHAADIEELIADKSERSVTLLGHSFGGPVAASVGSASVRQVLAFGVKLDWTRRRDRKGA